MYYTLSYSYSWVFAIVREDVLEIKLSKSLSELNDSFIAYSSKAFLLVG